MSDFRVETKHIWRYGPHRHVAYAVLDSATGRPSTKKRMVPDLYGEPRLHGDELARLLNAWRQRALALPETSVPIVPRGAGTIDAGLPLNPPARRDTPGIR